MGVRERGWDALTSLIKLEGKVKRQSEAVKVHRQKIEIRPGG